jgi:protein involved in polysaccharide export with SLBB domain
MSEVWKTKYGPRRVRRDPPTLQEAIAAARGLTDDVQAQVEIAASLMELPIEQVRSELLKSGGQRKDIKTIGVTAGRPGALRTVVVERKISRRPAALRTMK